MSERRGFKDQISDVLTEALPDPTEGALEKWLAPTTESRIEQIPVERIRDRAVRGDVDVTEPAYRALRASIRASGVLQPLLLRPSGDGDYEVVSGSRRLRAARDTAQSAVPAVVRELNDVQALVGGSWDAVLRSGLSPRESSALVAQLVAAGMGEGEATALVATAPVREEPAADVALRTDGVETVSSEATAEAAVAPDAGAADAAAPEVAAETVAAQEAETTDAAAPEAAAETAVVPAAETSFPEAAAEAAAAPATGPSHVAAPEATAESVAAPDGEATDAAAPEVTAEGTAPEAEAIAATDDTPGGPVDTEASVGTDATAADTAPAVEPDIDVDEDAFGWPAPDSAPAATAPTTPPAPLPIDPTRFPVAPLGSDDAAAGAAAQAVPSTDTPSNGAAPHTPIADAPAAEPATAVTAEGAAAEATPAAEPTEPATAAAEAPEAAAAPAPEPPATADVGATAAAPDASGSADPQTAEAAAPQPANAVEDSADEPAVVVAPADSSAATGSTPHVIRIKLPEAASAVAEDEAADGSMPVAAPAAPAATAEAEAGSRLVDPAPEADTPTAAPPVRTALPVPALLRRGPLFYAVLGIGLAVGAIVFILTSVLEGVGGTTSIIAAVVVAVVGFVTAMVSLAQPRSRT